ncbi:MAG: hypothetical protein AAFY63_18965 [Cyanobacteria bacterium J06643_13]
MLRDASHHQVIDKFSFITSLSLSRFANADASSGSDKIERDQAVNSQQRAALAHLASKTPTQTQSRTAASAIVSTANLAAAIDTSWYQPTSDYSLSLAEIINSGTAGEPVANFNSSSSKKRSYLGKILFGLACSYCLFVLWWVFGHQSNRILTVLTGGKNVVLTKSDVKFIDYMERSLEQIEREIAAQKESNESVVYVPVYTPSQTVNSNIPLATAPSRISPQQTSPAAPRPLPIPAPPPLPAPTPIPSSSGQNTAMPAASSTIAAKPQVNHTLIGVLELGGDRSAALVKVAGKTRRVWIGEEINRDGWLLDSVGNQRANISYQGQTRSISVGETF